MNINITLLGSMVVFGLFVWFTMKLIWPHIMTALQEREDKIADGLAAAERGRRDLELAQHKATDMMRDTKLKSAEILDQATKRAAKIIEDAKEDGRKTGERMIAQANAEIEQQRFAAQESLRKEIAAIVIAGAEKILGQSVDESANNDMIEKFLDEVAGR